MSIKVSPLSRRTLLRGAAGASLAIPCLEIMLNSSGTAYADGQALLKRFGFWFFGDGAHKGWADTPTGALTLPYGMKSLERHVSRLSLVSGLGLSSFGDYAANRHNVGAASVSTCVAPINGAGSPGGPSVDQLIAGKLTAGRRKSVQTALYTNPQTDTPLWATVSHAGANAPILPVTNPKTLFDDLFGGGVGQPPQTGPTVNRAKLKRSALDAVNEDLKALKTKVGRADRLRLDAYADGIAELQKQLVDPPKDPAQPTCNASSMSGEVSGFKDSGDLAIKNKLLARIIAQALACGLTQTFSFVMGFPADNPTWYPAAGTTHHELGHKGYPEHPDLAKSTDVIMSYLAVWLDAFAAIDEGSGKLIDNMAMLSSSEVAFNHEPGNVPVILSGGLIKGGLHVKSSGPMTKGWLTVAQAVGAPLGQLGTADAYAKEVVSSVLL